MAWIGALVAGVTSAVATGATAGAGYSADKKMAREQMRFQERMRDTQFQAAADDLEAAGLNRILAAGTPAGSPQGAMAKFPHGQAAAAGQQAIATAMQVKQAQTEIKKKEAETKNIEADTTVRNQVAGRGEVVDKAIRVELETAEFNKAIARSNASKAEIQRFLYNAAQPVAEKLLKEVHEIGWEGVIDKIVNKGAEAFSGIGDAATNAGQFMLDQSIIGQLKKVMRASGMATHEINRLIHELFGQGQKNPNSIVPYRYLEGGRGGRNY